MPAEMTPAVGFRTLTEEDFQTIEKAISCEIWLEVQELRQQDADEYAHLAMRVFRRYLQSPGPHLTERDGADSTKPVAKT